LHGRLARQVALRAPCPFVENLPKGDFPVSSLRGISTLKDADQECLHRLGLLRFERLGARLPGSRGQPSEEREHQGHCHCDADAMPPHEFTGAIAPSVRPRRHRPLLEKPIQVLAIAPAPM
jgi:hypothetical protein